jgi:2-(1,2-epoxy-1,2-dihydrophenyl)acetyl-CoA isomerase
MYSPEAKKLQRQTGFLCTGLQRNSYLKPVNKRKISHVSAESDIFFLALYQTQKVIAFLPEDLYLSANPKAMFEHLLYEVTESVCTITLNRPEVYNAINDKLSYELQDAFKQAGTDDTVRVVVLTGAGKGFCSGQDLKSIAGAKIDSLAEVVRARYNPLITTMRNMPKPILCKLNGIAAGAGCSLALACDIIIASEEASLAEIFIGIGLVMDSGSSYFLPRLVGSAKAFELSTMGTKVPAKEAESMGLVNKTVPAAQLDNAVAQYVGYYASAPTKAVGLMKRMLNLSYHSSLEEMLEYEALYQELAGKTQDNKEGIQAFLEKRKPDFKGK